MRLAITDVPTESRTLDAETVTTLQRVADNSKVVGAVPKAFAAAPEDPERLVLLLAELSREERQLVGEAAVSEGLLRQDELKRTLDPGGHSDVVADAVRLVIWTRDRSFSIVALPLLEFTLALIFCFSAGIQLKKGCHSSLAWLGVDASLALMLGISLLGTVWLLTSSYYMFLANPRKVVANWKATLRCPTNEGEPASWKYFTFDKVNQATHGVEPFFGRISVYLLVLAACSFVLLCGWVIWGVLDVFILLTRGCVSEFWIIFLVCVLCRLAYLAHLVARVTGYFPSIVVQVDRPVPTSAQPIAGQGPDESYGTMIHDAQEAIDRQGNRLTALLDAATGVADDVNEASNAPTNAQDQDLASLEAGEATGHPGADTAIVHTGATTNEPATALSNEAEAGQDPASGPGNPDAELGRAEMDAQDPDAPSTDAGKAETGTGHADADAATGGHVDAELGHAPKDA